MPSNVDLRNALRSTWLNATYWSFANVTIHHVFLLGVESGQDLVSTHAEAAKYSDLLQADFAENHYNLTVKEHLFFNFIESNCPQVDFAFKGDDDSMLIPQNAYYHIQKLQTNTVRRRRNYVKSFQVYRDFLLRNIQ